MDEERDGVGDISFFFSCAAEFGFLVGRVSICNR